VQRVADLACLSRLGFYFDNPYEHGKDPFRRLILIARKKLLFPSHKVNRLSWQKPNLRRV